MKILICILSCFLFSQTSQASPTLNWRAKVQDLAEKNFKHPAWGYAHSLRVYQLAKELGASDGAQLDDDVLYAAAVLHDMATYSPWAKDGVDHADQAALLVEQILDGTNFPSAKLDAVRQAIKTHMYYRVPVSAEAIYIHDADTLEWLGAIGIARLLGLVDSKGGSPNLAEMVAQIEKNLAAVPEHVVSKAGMEELKERREQSTAFLKALRKQSNNFHSL